MKNYLNCVRNRNRKKSLPVPQQWIFSPDSNGNFKFSVQLNEIKGQKDFKRLAMLFLYGILKVTDVKGADPDPYFNVTDPEQ